MPLSVDISAKLDAGALVTTLVGSLNGHSAKLDAIVVPATGNQVGAATAAAGSFDPSAVAAATSRLADEAAAALGAIGPARDVLGAVATTLELVERATAGNLGQDVGDLAAALALELEGSREGGTLGVLMRVANLLGEAPTGRLIASLVESLTQSAGVTTPPALQQLGELLPAIDGLVRAVGGLMMLESVLSESERLTAIMSRQLDAGAVGRDIDGIMALFDPTLAARISAPNATDDAVLQALTDALSVGANRLDDLRERLSAAMGMGEATFAYLDVGQVQVEVGVAAALLRNVDLDPLARQLRAALAGLQPFMALDFSHVPAQSLDGLLTIAEAQVGAFAAQITAWDPAELATPVSEGIEALTAPLADLSQLIGGVTISVRAALDAIKGTIVDLPVDELATTITTTLAPITTALNLITALVGDISAALNTAAGAALTALEGVEGTVDDFKDEIETWFGDARDFVEELQLEQVVGAIADKVNAFTQALAQAQMKPYFDTAVSAIDTATGVVSAVPFGLLPASMKADVDAVAKPVKDVNVQSFETQVENLLGIAPGGTFALRGELEHAVSDIQDQYDQLIVTVRQHDPQQYLAQLDAKLQGLAVKISAIAPQVTLKPVQDAIDQMKTALASFDLEAELKPLQQLFDQAVAMLDQYSPAVLIAPLEQRVTDARTKVIDTVKLAEWSPALEDLAARATALLDTLDPAQLEPQLAALLTEARDLTANLPDVNPVWLGSIVAALHSGTGSRVYSWTFPTVQSWISHGGGAGALSARAANIADAIARTRDAVDSIDVAALSGQLIARIAPVRAALSSLIEKPALDGSPLKPRLEAVLARLQVEDALGALAANRARYLALLSAAAALGETLRRTGLSEVDTTIVKLRATFEPVITLLDTVRAFLGTAGVPDVDKGVVQMVRSLFDVAPPARLAALAAPIFDALRNRVDALLKAVITPIKAGIDKLQTLIAAIDLKPLKDAVDQVFQSALAELQALSPAVLLAQPIAAFNTLKAQVAAFDPLTALLTVLNAVRDIAARVLAKLSAQQLLEQPIAIYRDIVDAFDALDVETLIAPVFDLLDSIAREVDEGLDATVTAFEHLQDALPSGGGGGSVSASASAG